MFTNTSPDMGGTQERGNTCNYYTDLQKGKKEKKIGLGINLMKCKALRRSIIDQLEMIASRHGDTDSFLYLARNSKKRLANGSLETPVFATYYIMGASNILLKNIIYIEDFLKK